MVKIFGGVIGRSLCRMGLFSPSAVRNYIHAYSFEKYKYTQYRNIGDVQYRQICAVLEKIFGPDTGTEEVITSVK